MNTFWKIVGKLMYEDIPFKMDKLDTWYLVSNEYEFELDNTIENKPNDVAYFYKTLELEEDPYTTNDADEIMAIIKQKVREKK